MSSTKPRFFQDLYGQFNAPINEFDCGRYCSPYNENGAPFCCDTTHMVPAAYKAEWDYLKANTDLWHVWRNPDPVETQCLEAETPAGQVLIACQGHSRCQRPYRSLTCRSFPFFPYHNSQGDFLGLSVYWEYEDRCWVISNLRVVNSDYRAEFITAFEALFDRYPGERQTFQVFSGTMRHLYQECQRAIPLLHRNGFAYKVTPHNERARRVPVEEMPQFGPYKIPSALRFPEEIPLHTGPKQG